MTWTIIGQVATASGRSQQFDLAGVGSPFTLPAANFRPMQPRLRLLHDHDETWDLGGQGVVHLERSAVDGLLCVATIDVDLSEMLANGEWFMSGGVRTTPTGAPLEFGHGKLHEVSLVRKPAMLGTHPLRWSRTNIVTDSGGAPHGLPMRWHDTWQRAHQRATSYRFQRADFLLIEDVDLPKPAAAPLPTAKARSTRSVDLGPPRRRTFSGATLTLR